MNYLEQVVSFSKIDTTKVELLQRLKFRGPTHVIDVQIIPTEIKKLQVREVSSKTGRNLSYEIRTR